MTQLIGQCIHLCAAFVAECGQDTDGMLREGQVLAVLQRLFMPLAAVGAQEPFSMKATVRFW